LNSKERTQSNLLAIFGMIGRERAYHNMTMAVASNRRSSILEI